MEVKHKYCRSVTSRLCRAVGSMCLQCLPQGTCTSEQYTRQMQRAVPIVDDDMYPFRDASAPFLVDTPQTLRCSTHVVTCNFVGDRRKLPKLIEATCPAHKRMVICFLTPNH